MKISVDWKLPVRLKQIAEEEKPHWDNKKLMDFAQKFRKHHAKNATEFISEHSIEVSWKGWLGRERDSFEKKESHSYGLRCASPGCTKDGVMSHSTTGGPWMCPEHFW